MTGSVVKVKYVAHEATVPMGNSLLFRQIDMALSCILNVNVYTHRQMLRSYFLREASLCNEKQWLLKVQRLTGEHSALNRTFMPPHVRLGEQEIYDSQENTERRHVTSYLQNTKQPLKKNLTAATARELQKILLIKSPSRTQERCMGIHSSLLNYYNNNWCVLG